MNGTPEYLRRLLLGAARGTIPAASVTCATIAHDEWCAIYSHGPCNCDPIITMRNNGRMVELMADGSVRDLGARQ